MPFRRLAVLALAIACRSRDRTSSAAASDNGNRAVSICGLVLPATLPRDSIAVRCAEGFVASNGYTSRPVQDTTAISREFIEVGTTPAEVLASRRNSLGPRGIVLCHNRREQAGYTVGFVAPDDTVMKVGRAVTMDSTFRELKIEHEDYLPSAAAAMTGCARVGQHAKLH